MIFLKLDDESGGKQEKVDENGKVNKGSGSLNVTFSRKNDIPVHYAAIL